MREYKPPLTANFRSNYKSPQPADIPVMWTDTVLRESEAKADTIQTMLGMELCDECPFSDCHGWYQKRPECPVNMAGYITKGGNFKTTNINGNSSIGIDPDKFSDEGRDKYYSLIKQRDALRTSIKLKGKNPSEDPNYVKVINAMYVIRRREGKKRA